MGFLDLKECRDAATYDRIDRFSSDLELDGCGVDYPALSSVTQALRNPATCLLGLGMTESDCGHRQCALVCNNPTARTRSGILNQRLAQRSR